MQQSCTHFRIFLGVTFVVALAQGQARAQTWVALSDSAWRLSVQNLNDRALAVQKSAVETAIAQLGGQDTTIADLLGGVAWYNWVLGRIDSALGATDRSLSIYRQTIVPHHPKIADMLHRKGTCLWDLGRYSEGEKVLREAAEMRAHLFGPEAGPTQRSLVNLAALLQEEGKIREADQLYTFLLALWKRNGEPVGSVASVNIGAFYTALGRHALAESLLTQAFRAHYEHRDDPFLLSNLGHLYQVTGRLGLAETTLRHAVAAVDTFEGRNNPDHPARGFFRITLGEFYRIANRFSEAESVLVEGMQILERTGRQDFVYGLRGTRSLAELYMDAHQLEKARRALAHLVDETTVTLGAEHPDMVSAYLSMGRWHTLCANDSMALEYAVRSARLAARVLSRAMGVSTEAEALKSAGALRSSIDAVITAALAMGRKGGKIPDAAFDVLVETKGIITDAFIVRNRGGRSESSGQRGRLRTMQAELARAYVTAVASGATPQARRIDSLSLAVDSLETLLNRGRDATATVAPGGGVRVRRLADLLDPGAAVVEFFKYEPPWAGTHRDRSRYAALVYDASGKTAFLDLVSADTVAALIREFRRQMDDMVSGVPSVRNAAALKQKARSLYGAIWKPLEQVVEGKAIVFIAPDGDLHQLSYAGLVGDDHRYLIERHAIHHLSASRDLIAFSIRPPRTGEGMLAFGDPDFDARPGKAGRVTDGRVPVQDAGDSSFVAALRAGEFGSVDRLIRRLPGTRLEVRAIAAKVGGARIFTGRAASEENFKWYAAGKSQIHIATHAYSLYGTRAVAGEFAAWYSLENPLLHSGLLLAGANTSRRVIGQLPGEDGILTALEVSGLDLSGTDLVVLSACETGLGKIEQGEGVFGLRRAFQQAGARTVISSLWRIPDQETISFMTMLYSPGKAAYPERLRDIALKHIREARLRGRPDAPASWSGFVATGDWRFPPKRD